MYKRQEQGDPVIRGVGMFDWKEKSFSALGSIKEGDKIRLCLPPDFEVVDEVRGNAEKIHQNEIPEPDALLMLSLIHILQSRCHTYVLITIR